MATDLTSTPVDATASRAYAGNLGRLYEGAAASFARPTFAFVDTERPVNGAHRTAATTVADPEVIADLADSPELRAIEELRAWLHLTYEEVARVAGLRSPSLLHHWRQRYRTGSPVRPRAGTVEQLWRVHALARAVAEALQGADQGYAVQLWVRHPEAGVTSLDLLLAGRVDAAEQRARRLLFDSDARAVPAWRVATVEPDSDLTPAETPPAPEYGDTDFA